MAMDVEVEIRDLKRRVGELEGSFGFGLLTHQISSLHKDLLAFEARTEQRFNKVDERFDCLEGKVDGLDRKIDSLDRKIDAKVDGLAGTLPAIIGDAIRDVLRERDDKRSGALT
jgi:hypothetical protein